MDDLTVRDRAHLAALEATFPGWHITIEHGEWRAERRGPITGRQRDAGVREQVTAPTPIDLSAALAGQLGILARMGAA
ncbi:hypothetical protein [Spongiactinospora sp. TRM90649]|uniref:hypothetical protein n=1 Tax=Spongiactinospora sp. TRM90649 TaxID=3031114 RepID=UPI0023F9050C|nr:hypothetical protein [Spongiactinospora sp. TRM90649]MDF5754676.1 hypothetical protein [Spongiactinospora sp. TRM90649]